MLYLAIWLFVALDRYVEFQLEYVHSDLTTDTELRVQMLVFSLAWPFVMAFRIGVYIYKLITKKI